MSTYVRASYVEKLHLVGLNPIPVYAIAISVLSISNNVAGLIVRYGRKVCI